MTMNYRDLGRIEEAMVDALDLVIDMHNEGSPHSSECGCELCSHYSRAGQLVDKHALLFDEVHAHREAEKRERQAEAERSEKYVTWWVAQFKAGRNLTYRDVENHFEKGIEPKPPKRIYVEGCKACAAIGKGGFGPPHDASDSCESGKREHCTCDTCF